MHYKLDKKTEVVLTRIVARRQRLQSLKDRVSSNNCGNNSAPGKIQQVKEHASTINGDVDEPYESNADSRLQLPFATGDYITQSFDAATHNDMMEREVCTSLKCLISNEMFNVNLRALSCMTRFNEAHRAKISGRNPKMLK